MDDVENVVSRSIGEAMTYFRRQAQLTNLWLLAYYNPTLSEEENHRAARAAVAAGWTADTLTDRE